MREAFTAAGNEKRNDNSGTRSVATAAYARAHTFRRSVFTRRSVRRHYHARSRELFAFNVARFACNNNVPGYAACTREVRDVDGVSIRIRRRQNLSTRSYGIVVLRTWTMLLFTFSPSPTTTPPISCSPTTNYDRIECTMILRCPRLGPLATWQADDSNNFWLRVASCSRRFRFVYNLIVSPYMRPRGLQLLFFFFFWSTLSRRRVC
jgi:hypothetical protein